MMELKNKAKTLSIVRFDGKVMKDIKNIAKGNKKDKELSILNTLKFSFDNNEMKVLYKNQEYSITQNFDSDSVVTSGNSEFLIDFDIVKKLTHINNDEEYSFQVLDNKVEFTRNDGKITLDTFSIKEHDFTNNIENNFTHIDDSNHNEILKLNRALHSVSKLDSRPVLKNVLIRDGMIHSTDSHRLFRVNSDIKYDNDIKLAHDGIKKLKDIFNKNEEIQLLIDENDSFDEGKRVYKDKYACFKSKNKRVEIKMNRNNYPELNRLIPTDFTTEIVISNMKDFKQVVQNATKNSKDMFNNPITLTISNSNLKVTSRKSKEYSEDNYIKSIDIDNFYGEDLKIVMNGKYLLDGIKQLNTKESIRCQFSGSMRPFIIRPEDNKQDVLSLILPIRNFY